MAINWFNVVSTIAVFLIFWAIYAIYRHNKTGSPFSEEWARGMGLHFWLSHPGALVLITIGPSIIFTLLLVGPLLQSDLSEVNWLVYPIILFLALPILGGVAYVFGRKNEGVKQTILYVLGVWLVLLILAVIIAVRGVSGQ